jgi:hypothetical protein
MFGIHHIYIYRNTNHLNDGHFVGATTEKTAEVIQAISPSHGDRPKCQAVAWQINFYSLAKPKR